MFETVIVCPATVFRFINPVVDTNFKFIYFACRDTAGQVSVFWSTKNDKSIASYTVERGKDSLVFSVITTRPFDQRDGIQYYLYSDNQPLAGLSYYRIRITDTSGIISYSKIVTVSSLNNTILL